MLKNIDEKIPSELREHNMKMGDESQIYINALHDIFTSKMDHPRILKIRNIFHFLFWMRRVLEK